MGVHPDPATFGQAAPAQHAPEPAPVVVENIKQEAEKLVEAVDAALIPSPAVTPAPVVEPQVWAAQELPTHLESNTPVCSYLTTHSRLEHFTRHGGAKCSVQVLDQFGR